MQSFPFPFPSLSLSLPNCCSCTLSPKRLLFAYPSAEFGGGMRSMQMGLNQAKCSLALICHHRSPFEIGSVGWYAEIFDEKSGCPPMTPLSPTVHTGPILSLIWLSPTRHVKPPFSDKLRQQQQQQQQLLRLSILLANYRSKSRRSRGLSLARGLPTCPLARLPW